MKKNILLILLSFGFLFSNAQDETVCADKKRIALYTNVIGGGYIHWTSRFRDEDGEYTLRGNGFNSGPNVALYYMVSERFKIGVNGMYTFTLINLKNNDGLTRDVFKQKNNRRDILAVGPTIQYSLIHSDDWDFITCLDAGTFWLKRDNFNETTRSRMFGSVGLIIERKITRTFGVFLSPDYTMYMYKHNVSGIKKKSQMQTLNANLGISLKF